MADDTTRIINLTEATDVSDGMYLVTDASTGTRKLLVEKLVEHITNLNDLGLSIVDGELCVTYEE